MNQDQIIINTTNHDMDAIKKVIYDLEIRRMTKELEPQINEILFLEGLKSRVINYKYLKSKFGSYHRKKELITLNTFLATQPKELLYYVILHEYAHILVFNHSKHFYDVLDRWLPNHRVLQKRLKNIAIY
jgi:predicted metal-dependent hydrolase